MTADLPPYPSYKPSGSPWLDQVPVPWQEVRLKYAAAIQTGITLGKDYGSQELVEYPYLRVANVQAGSLKLSNVATVRVPRAEVQGATLRGGDVLMTEGGDIDKLGRGTVWRGEIDNCLHQNHIFVVRPRKHLLLPEYLAYLSSAPYGRRYFELTAKQTTNLASTNSTILGRFPLPLPPIDEQHSIVRFIGHLDRLTARYIRARQNLLKLLDEQRRAIIHQAITEGVDASVGRSDSEVRWLGQIPEHWKVMRLKSLVHRIDQGVSPQAENFLADGESWGVLKAGCVNRGLFRETEHKRLPAGFIVDSDLKVEEGDVLVSRASGSPQLVGSVGRIRELHYNLILSDKTFRLRFNSLVDPDFMTLAMNSRYYRLQVERAISGAEGLANNLPLSALKAFVFAVPPPLEQERIVLSLRDHTSRLDTAIERLEGEVLLMREYWTRLITDVVTGRLDVREAAAGLPEVDEAPGEMGLADDLLGEGDEAELGMDEREEVTE